MSDGKSIVSGWTDGNIRAFTPQSGRLAYIIKSAHKTGLIPISSKGSTASSSQFVPGGVSCLSTSLDCFAILSGGSDCELRLYHVGK